MFRRYVLINLNLENDLSAVATVTGNVRNRKKINCSKNCYLVLAGGPPRVVGPGAPHHLHHLYGRHCKRPSDVDLFLFQLPAFREELAAVGRDLDFQFLALLAGN